MIVTVKQRNRPSLLREGRIPSGATSLRRLLVQYTQQCFKPRGRISTCWILAAFTSCREHTGEAYRVSGSYGSCSEYSLTQRRPSSPEPNGITLAPYRAVPKGVAAKDQTEACSARENCKARLRNPSCRKHSLPIRVCGGCDSAGVGMVFETIPRTCHPCVQD